MLIPYEYKVDVITPVNILFMMMIIMTFVSVEQRPGWGEEVYVRHWIYMDLPHKDHLPWTFSHPLSPP